ncbi:Rieske (2Fe-2S) domain protein [Acidimicrobium ferrooxidans DSM 10331]|uniref:Cytochrome bc1 complex Rieske iron-sulfur subunit n=1 Tax=Acidimicrobium ferrooxidans (strain DSM 10331 / JCM 15462 / NBRC 103882 / ICP) TaxID=525909 RepID=C7M192_ACIFD|nr:ubiquinol-cytochrome c reductase iron-sulfur subunit [Acidimicrobium ferrooxidans]ACU54740.1 Rieske (2Fe-2S) domain protein [Acidimicrobium ferrooxidans DSM 10331]
MTVSRTGPTSSTEETPERRPFVERLIAISFSLSVLATIGLGVTYWLGGQPQVEGALLFVALGGIGVGIVAWGKYLVPQGPYVQERHELRSDDVEREAMHASLSRGLNQVQRRSFLLRLLGASVGAFGLINLFPFLRSLGPVPGKSLFLTDWKAGSRLVTASGRVVTVNDLEVGGMLTVFPEGWENSPMNAIDQVVLVRPATTDLVTRPGRETWGPQGYLAFSKVCTHAGCPVGLYQELTQQLLCPCHQSLFDVLTGATNVFGPAPRPLPQLPLYIDSEGVLRAQAGFDEPVGPGFWERGA